VLLHSVEIQMSLKIIPEWEVILDSSKASRISIHPVPNAFSVRKLEKLCK